MDIKVKGREKQIELSGDVIKEIIVYGSGKVLFRVNCGYFAEYGGREFYSSLYDGRPVALILENEPKRAVKENLNRKDNYYRKVSGRYAFESGLALYIHESEISVTDDGEKLAMQTREEKNYLHAYTLNLKCGAIMRRCKAERIAGVGPEWTIPDNGKWGSGWGSKEAPVYDTYENPRTGEKGVIKRWYELETVYTLPTAARYFCRTEYSAERIRAREIADKLNENRVFHREVSCYEIEKLMQYFELTEKQ